MAKIYTSVFIVYICFGRATGIVNIDPEKKEKIDNFANSLLFDCNKHSNIVGMNLAVVFDGAVLYTTGYGVKNLSKSFLNCKHIKVKTWRKEFQHYSSFMRSKCPSNVCNEHIKK